MKISLNTKRFTLNPESGFVPIFIAITAVLIALLVSGGVFYYTTVNKHSSGSVACTMEAKQCPDGSYVGRTPPSCEFTPCPTAKSSVTSTIDTSSSLSTSTSGSSTTLTTGWKTYTNTQYGFSFKYPTQFTLEEYRGSIGLRDHPPDPNAEGGEGIYFSVDFSTTTITSLNGWFDATYADRKASGESLPTKENIVFNGHSALKINDPIGMGGCDQESINILQNGILYSVSDPQCYAGASTTHGATIIAINSTFTFTPSTSLGTGTPSSTTGTVPTTVLVNGACIPKFTIEHSSELTASEAYAGECTKQTSKLTCERVDMYRASTKSFGNADGIPDCDWVIN